MGAAGKRVKANPGRAGTDNESRADFEARLEDPRYPRGNRRASGRDHLKPVRRGTMPKTGGGVRPRGIPTGADRVAQTGEGVGTGLGADLSSGFLRVSTEPVGPGGTAGSGTREGFSDPPGDGLGRAWRAT